MLCSSNNSNSWMIPNVDLLIDVVNFDRGCVSIRKKPRRLCPPRGRGSWQCSRHTCRCCLAGCRWRSSADCFWSGDPWRFGHTTCQCCLCSCRLGYPLWGFPQWTEDAHLSTSWRLTHSGWWSLRPPAATCRMQWWAGKESEEEERFSCC